MLGLLGPNGAGKTTIIRCITGEEVPIQGRVSMHFEPRETVDLNPSTAAAQPFFSLRRRSLNSNVALGGDLEQGQLLHARRATPKLFLGLCPQETALSADLTVEEHLLFFASLREVRDPHKSVEEFLRVIRLEDRRRASPNELSGGMRRRLAIGCAMVGQPALALLDEPTTGLDPAARRVIWDVVRDARDAGTACLLTTHMLEEAEELCTHILVVKSGRVAAEGSVQELKDTWSSGYMLSVDCKVGEETKVQEFVASLLPRQHATPLKTSLHGQMLFNVSKDAEFIGNLFIQLARGADAGGIRRWGISQATLEDAYLRIIAH